MQFEDSFLFCNGSLYLFCAEASWFDVIGEFIFIFVSCASEVLGQTNVTKHFPHAFL